MLVLLFLPPFASSTLAKRNPFLSISFLEKVKKLRATLPPLSPAGNSQEAKSHESKPSLDPTLPEKINRGLLVVTFAENFRFEQSNRLESLLRGALFFSLGLQSPFPPGWCHMQAFPDLLSQSIRKKRRGQLWADFPRSPTYVYVISSEQAMTRCFFFWSFLR
jgi:hypothetical protein